MQNPANNLDSTRDIDLNAITSRKVILGFEFAFIFFLFNVITNKWFENSDNIYGGYNIFIKLLSDFQDGISPMRSIFLLVSTFGTMAVLIGITVVWVLKLIRNIKDDTLESNKLDRIVGYIMAVYLPLGAIITFLGVGGSLWTYRFFSFLAFLIALFYVPKMVRITSETLIARIKKSKESNILFRALSEVKSFMFQKLFVVIFMAPVSAFMLSSLVDAKNTTGPLIIAVGLTTAIALLYLVLFLISTFVKSFDAIYEKTDILMVLAGVASFAALVLVNFSGSDLQGFQVLKVVSYLFLIASIACSVFYTAAIPLRFWGGWILMVSTFIFGLIRF